SFDPLEMTAQHIGVADEGGDEAVVRMAIDLVWPVELADAAVGDHRDAVREAERLALVMGDEDGGYAELALNLLEFDLHRGAQIAVERGERLVQQQHLGTNDEGAGERDALLLAAGELARLAILQARKLDQRKRVAHPPRDLWLGQAAPLEPHPHLGPP